MESSSRLSRDDAHSDRPAAAQCVDVGGRSGSSGVDDGFLGIQRAGLSALRALSRQVVDAAVAEVEERFREACTAAEDALQDRLREIENRATAELAVIERTRADQSTPMQTAAKTAAAKISAETRAVLQRIQAASVDREAEADLLLQHQYLVADEVAKANCERLKKERLAAEKQAAEANQNLEGLRSRIDNEMLRLGVEPPPVDVAEIHETPPSEDPGADYERHLHAVVEQLDTLEHIRVGRVFVGGRMYLVLMLFCAAVVGSFAALSYSGIAGAPPFKVSGPISLIASIAVSLIFGWIMHQRERARVLAVYGPLARSYALARQALDVRIAKKRERYQTLERRAAEILRNNPEKAAAKRQFDATLVEIKAKAAELAAAQNETQRNQLADIEARRDAALRTITSDADQRTGQIQQERDRQTATAHEAYEKSVGVARLRHDAERAAFEQNWQIELGRIRCLLSAGDRFIDSMAELLETPGQPIHASNSNAEGLVGLGHWQFDWTQLSPIVPELAELRAGRQAIDTSPIVLGSRNHRSLLLQTDRAGRQQAINTLRLAMLRLLTTQPAGRVRFTIIDPVGLGESFAGFMHLVDYQEALVGSRIWTESEHVEARLTELTSHMENVIQKYLRNEFATIEEYNRQAGPLAEPYRYLVIADFPANFNENAVRRLSSIISSGARCGVHTLIMHDRRLGLPAGLPLEDLAGEALHLVHDGQRFVAKDALLRHFPLVLDEMPSEDELTQIMHRVGRHAKDAFRVEVPFDAIVPSADQRWTQDAGTQLSIPIGHAGAVRFQNFTLGRGLAQHALMAGKTGSGKSTLMHVIITNLALTYDPHELELYLIDFKKGVEFKTYVTHELPHARAIAIESDREFGVSVLQRLDAEMTRRGDMFRAAGVQDLPAYRAATGKALPRTLLIVDEFQVFFSEDDRLAQDASALLDRLVRQGRAFGIHLLLGSQTLAGSAGLARSTLGQMAVRIALQCSEADSLLILDDTNAAARLLSRPGEAIYNDAGGLIAGNSNFQVAWLSDGQQAGYLDDVTSLAKARHWRGPPPIVFEGNALADLRHNQQAMKLIEASSPPAIAAPQIWLGEPVAIKDPTSVSLRRQSGANLLIVGQRDDVSQSLLAASILSIAIQKPPRAARFYILGGPVDEQTPRGGLGDAAAVLPHDVRWVESREIAGVITDLAAEMQRRIDQGAQNEPGVYLIVDGVHRFRGLRRREDSFSFGSSDADAAPATDRQFADLLREGPPVGMHVIAWADTLATLERTLDRQSLREFDSRVLFQMSAADSSNLIDSPEANRLGLYRALLFSEERGVIEKFRPYGPLDSVWLAGLKSALDRK